MKNHSTNNKVWRREFVICKCFKFKYYETNYTTDSGTKSNATSSTSNSTRIRTIWYIYDTDESIQQKADDNEAELENLHLKKKRKDNKLITTLEAEFTGPIQIDNMMASSSKSGIRGNLRGTSSSSAAIRPSASSAASGQFQYISFEEIEPIPRDISMPDLIELAKRRTYYICMYRYRYI